MILLMAFLFVGLSKISEVLMISVEHILARKFRKKRVDFFGKEEYAEESVWSETLANLTLRTLAFNCFEIFYTLIDLIINNFRINNTNGLSVLLV